jgi:hypothetical protein
MKRVFQILSMAVIVLTAVNCGGKGTGSAIQQLKPVDKLTPADMTWAKINGLYGKVKTVTTDNSVVEYSEAGEPANESWTGKNRYTLKQDNGETEKFTVTYNNNSRHDKIVGTNDDGDCEGCHEHEFDNYGRIVKNYYSMGYERDQLTYTYNNADALPSSYYWEIGDERVAWVYEYLAIDSHGNWTERKTTEVTYTHFWENDKEVLTEKSRKKPVIEKRTITYYE